MLTETLGVQEKSFTNVLCASKHVNIVDDGEKHFKRHVETERMEPIYVFLSVLPNGNKVIEF